MTGEGKTGDDAVSVLMRTQQGCHGDGFSKADLIQSFPFIEYNVLIRVRCQKYRLTF